MLGVACVVVSFAAPQSCVTWSLLNAFAWSGAGLAGIGKKGKKRNSQAS